MPTKMANSKAWCFEICELRVGCKDLLRCASVSRHRLSQWTQTQLDVDGFGRRDAASISVCYNDVNSQNPEAQLGRLPAVVAATAQSIQWSCADTTADPVADAF